MASMDQVLELLRCSDRSFQRTQRRQRRFIVAFALVTVPFYVGGLVVAVANLLRTWQGGDWLIDFWGPFASVAIVITSLAKLATYRDDRVTSYQPLADLRDALHRGDETLAPTVATPDVATEPAAPSVNDGRLGPVRRPLGSGESAVTSAGSLSMIFGGLALVTLIVGIPTALATDSRTEVLILIVTCVPLTCLLFLYGARALGRFSVRVDSDGLRWRTPIGFRRRLRWMDAYAFFEVEHTASLATNPETQYVVLGERTVLAWRLPNARAASTERGKSIELYHSISEHTGLPLRNATTEALRIVGSTSGSSLVPKAEVRRRFKIFGLIAAPALIIAVIGGALQLAQPLYNEHLYMQARSHASLYVNPLTSDRGDWQVTTDTAFINGSYVLLADDETTFEVEQTLPRQYSDALIEVDARSLAGIYSGDVGFILHSQKAYFDTATADVSTDGFFTVGPFSDRPATPFDPGADFGSSSAIMTGEGASNRLGLLIQGSQYTFFVNGHYVGGFNDDRFTGAEVSLYADVGYGAFNNFAVYPLN